MLSEYGCTEAEADAAMRDAVAARLTIAADALSLETPAAVRASLTTARAQLGTWNALSRAERHALYVASGRLVEVVTHAVAGMVAA